MRRISVTGLGYVGLPLAVSFAKHTRVTGFDTNAALIKQLSDGEGKSFVVNRGDLLNENISFTDDPKKLTDANFHIIAVPTPINASREPDLEMLLSATRTIAGILKKQDIVVFESTVYPGLTEEECIPLLEEVSGLICGQDFQVGYSPERINPGDELHTLENTVKIVAAQNRETLDVISEMYMLVVKAGLHRVENIKVAEAAKVIENTQRDINIALMNELSLIFDRLRIDTADVLEAAGTKWNFHRFQPGLVGGHCIGVDPYYLTHKARMLGYSPRVILSGRSVNDAMGVYVARMVVKQLIKAGKVVKGALVTILGITFKEDTPDIRNTRVIDIVRELESFDIRVQIHDPLAEPDEVKNEYGRTLSDSKQLEPSDGVVLAVTHREYTDAGWPLILSLLKQGQGVVFDVKSVLPRNTRPEGVDLLRL